MKQKIIEQLINYDFYFLESDNCIFLEHGIIVYTDNSITYQDGHDEFFNVSSSIISDIIGILELKYS